MLDLKGRIPFAAPTQALANHRQLEIALVEISHLLVSASAIDMVDVLGILGEAMDAESTFLSVSDWSEEAGVERATASHLLVWHRRGRDAARIRERSLLAAPPISGGGWPQGPARLQTYSEQGPTELVALPLLSEGDRFLGYLGVEHHHLSDEIVPEQARVLSVFGDLLASYYKRVFAERTLQENHERWRTLMQLHPDPVIVAGDEELLYVNRAATILFNAASPRELLTHRLADFIPAHRIDEFSRQIEEQLRSGAPEPFEQEIVRLDGEERVVEVLSAESTFKGRAATQTVLRDITERKASEERYRTFVETISEGIWRIDLQEPVSPERDPEVQAAHIVRHGVLGECNVMMAEMMGYDSPPEVIGRPFARIFAHLPPSLLEVFARSGYRLENFEFALQRKGRAARHFSLNAVGRVDRGGLYRIWGSCSEITARVEMERRMVAVLEEEQERIGHDLHDGIGQLLTGIRMLSENLVHRIEISEPAVAGTLEKINRFALEASERVRDICRGLAPPQLSQEPLALSLEMLCAQLSSYESTECLFEWDHRAEVDDPEAKIQLYRIAQEAINNALRHGRPRHITVRLRMQDATALLEVVDDGSGFDVDAEQGSSLGLYSMQRRASSVRARLEIESQPDGGTTVRALYNGLPAMPEAVAAQ